MSAYKRKRIGGYFSAGAQYGDLKAQLGMGGLYDIVRGRGDYTVRSNALYSGATVPFVRNPSYASNATVISHKEYLADIVTSPDAGEFKIQAFPLNPGLAQTFEWLAQIACNYEQYIFEGVLLCFRSMSADALNSTNTALGTVVMATNYNPYNPAFSNKAEMESYEFATSFKPSISSIHPIECAPNQTSVSELFVRTGSVPSGADQRLYDLGTFYIATTGFQGESVNIGELWITYQVALLKPKLYASLGNYGDFTIYTNTGYTNAQPLGTTAGEFTGNSSSLFSVDVSSNTISFPQYSFPTTYLILCYWNALTPVAVIYPNISGEPSGTISSFPALESPLTSTSSNYCHTQKIYQAPGNYTECGIEFVGGTLPNSGTPRVTIIISQMPNLDYNLS